MYFIIRKILSVIWRFYPDFLFRDSDLFLISFPKSGRHWVMFLLSNIMIDIAEMIEGGMIEPQAAKVMMDAYKWAAERMASKHHSAKQEIDHKSSDGTMGPTRIELVAPDDHCED